MQKENEPNIKLNIKEEFEDFKNNIVFLLNQANDRSNFFWRGYRNNILDEIINIVNLEIINLLSITLIEKEKNAA